MTVDQDNVSRILSVLSHPIRREILQNLSEKGECSFTDLMNALNVDTGKLSFHIRNLSDFLEQTPSGKYILSKTGDNAVRFLRDVEAWAPEVDVTRKTLLPLASFKKRAVSYLIDAGIALAVFMSTTLLSTLAQGSLFLLDGNLILFLLLFWMYLTLLEGFAGQTLGKRLIGLKTVRTDGKRLSYDHAAVRNFGVAFLLPFDLLVGLKLKDRRFLRYFDKFAGTTVIDLHL